jgi:hypothetical protein
MFKKNPDPRDFLNEINGTEAAGIDKYLPTDVIRKLAHLTKVSNYELFQKGIVEAVLEAHVDFITFPKQVYREEFVSRLDKLKRRAVHLAQEIDSLLHTQNPATLLAEEALSKVLDAKDRRKKSGLDALSEFRAIASILAHTVDLTKFLFSQKLPERGRPVGATGSGMGRDYFIMRLEFATLAAGGKLSLDKNARKGTLIDALELLRDYLPDGFVPRSVHPYASYQRVLTRARSEWKKYQKVTQPHY